MKHNIFYILPFCLALSCTQEISTPQTLSPQVEGYAVTAEIGEPMTRTMMDNGRSVLWSQGDKIKIFADNMPAGAVYSTTAHETSLGIFLPEAEAVEAALRYAAYPLAAVKDAKLAGTKVAVDFAALATQAFNSSLGANTVIADLPLVASSKGKAFKFQNVCGAIQFKVADYQNLGLKIKSLTITSLGEEQISSKMDVDLATGQVSQAKGEGAKTIQIDCGEGVSIATAGALNRGQGPIAFLPAGTYSGFQFDFTDTEGRCYSAKTAAAVKVTAGAVTPLAPLVLTLYYGKANSYRIDGAGSIDVDITPYFTLGTQFAHEGKICKNAAGETVGLPKTAAILWQRPAKGQSGSVVESAAIEGSVLKVKTTATLGNALVAVKDQAGTILWSYHIWVSPASDLTWKNDVLGTFEMMDRNLGATSTTIKDRNAYGLCYQWGRKDPIPNNLDGERPAKSPYESELSTLEKQAEVNDGNGHIAFTLRNPDVRLVGAADWYKGGSPASLWGNPNGTEGAGVGIKTVYDPCPQGYKVADMVCYAALTDKNKGQCNAQYGYLFDIDGAGTTNYFPTVGYLEYLAANNFKHRFLEYRGYIWTTVPNGTQALRFYYNNANLSRGAQARSVACGVRCVKL